MSWYLYHYHLQVTIPASASGLDSKEKKRQSPPMKAPSLTSQTPIRWRHRHPETPRLRVWASWSRRPQRNKYSSGCSKQPWISRIVTAIQYKKQLFWKFRPQNKFSQDSSQDWIGLWALHFPHPAVAVAAAFAAVDCHLSSIRIIMDDSHRGKMFVADLCHLMASLVVAKRTGWLSIVALRRIATLRTKLSNTKSGQWGQSGQWTYQELTLESYGLPEYGPPAGCVNLAMFSDQLPWKPRINTHGHVTNAARKRLLVTMVSLCRPHGGLSCQPQRSGCKKIDESGIHLWKCA